MLARACSVRGGAARPRTGGHDVVPDEQHVCGGEREQEEEAVRQHVRLHGVAHTGTLRCTLRRLTVKELEAVKKANGQIMNPLPELDTVAQLATC